jgi:hypothetical protein
MQLADFGQRLPVNVPWRVMPFDTTGFRGNVEAFVRDACWQCMRGA